MLKQVQHDGSVGMNINGIAAVVTGGASGLGEATARALAAKGAKSPSSIATSSAARKSPARSAAFSAKSM
jgi:NAD(P)-dependent dehydrogenase (short-subunit alcohol dehydrogenase family)